MARGATCRGSRDLRGWVATECRPGQSSRPYGPLGAPFLRSVPWPCPDCFCCFAVVPTDQTPTANAGLNVPSEHCAGLPAEEPRERRPCCFSRKAEVRRSL